MPHEEKKKLVCVRPRTLFLSLAATPLLLRPDPNPRSVALPEDDVRIRVSKHRQHGLQQERVLVLDTGADPVNDNIQLLNGP